MNVGEDVEKELAMDTYYNGIFTVMEISLFPVPLRATSTDIHHIVKP